MKFYFELYKMCYDKDNALTSPDTVNPEYAKLWVKLGLEKLSPIEVDLLESRYYDKISVSSLAADLHCSNTTVRNRTKKAFKVVFDTVVSEHNKDTTPTIPWYDNMIEQDTGLPDELFNRLYSHELMTWSRVLRLSYSTLTGLHGFSKDDVDLIFDYLYSKHDKEHIMCSVLASTVPCPVARGYCLSLPGDAKSHAVYCDTVELIEMLDTLRSNSDVTEITITVMGDEFNIRYTENAMLMHATSERGNRLVLMVPPLSGKVAVYVRLFDVQ